MRESRQVLQRETEQPAGAAERSERAWDRREGGPQWRGGMGLSTKLLVLTIIFVMIAEVLIFVPSVANFRRTWLMERLAAAQIASLATEAAPGGALPVRLRRELLQSARVHAIAVKLGDARRLILATEMPIMVEGHYDLREGYTFAEVLDALAVFFQSGERYIRVRGQPGFATGEFIEIVIAQAPLKAAMLRFALNILGLSIVISIITAALVYVALNTLLVRPIRRMVRNMLAFAENPEDSGRIIIPSGREDEIGTAERVLANMQRDLSQTLQNKSRLAALGLAISKINHDLRNMLSTAHLISDRLSAVPDPTVQRFAPKLIKALDRAIRLCTETLKYGRAREPVPERSRFRLAELVAEVGESLALPRPGMARFVVDIPEGLEIHADRDQLFRVLSNLARNACEAIEMTPERGEEGEIRISARIEPHERPQAGQSRIVPKRRQTAEQERRTVIIEVSDTGPGVPEAARTHLFQAFQGTVRKGGTGLGLAIAAELVQAHGGRIALVESRRGALFRITLPSRAPANARA